MEPTPLSHLDDLDVGGEGVAELWVGAHGPELLSDPPHEPPHRRGEHPPVQLGPGPPAGRVVGRSLPGDRARGESGILKVIKNWARSITGRKQITGVYARI